MYRASIVTEDDCIYLLNNLREEDHIEAKTAKGINYRQVILEELKTWNNNFLMAKTKKDDTPVLICGCWPLKENPSIGIVWLLSTPEIKKHQICFLKEMRKEINKYDLEFGLTFNYLYKENILAKRWLKWVGYKFPGENEKKDFLDKHFLSMKVPEGFEVFYRERNITGLGE